MVQFRLCVSLPLLLCVLSTLIGRSNGKCEIETKGDPCKEDPSDGCWDYVGDTADGKPFFKKTITWALVVKTKVYMYYDADCDGPNGNSKNDHGQWMIASNDKFGTPSQTRTSDLDDSEHCVADRDDNAAYTDDTTSMIPPSGKWHRLCFGGVFPFNTEETWQVVNNIKITGCPDLPVWKRDYTYVWGQWTPNKAGSSCGGVETRIAAESCDALNGCSCKASTKWQADTLQQTRSQPPCTTRTTSTTTTTTTTTTATTTTTTTTATTSTSTLTLTDVRTASATPRTPQAGVDADASIVGSSSSTNSASSISPEDDDEKDEDGEGGPSLALGWIVTIAVMVLAAVVLGGVLIAARVRASNAAEAAYAHAAGGDIAYNQAYNQGGSMDYLEPSARQSQLYDAAEETRRQIKAAVSNSGSGSAGPALDADNYVLDEYYSTQQEGRRHGTVTARTNSGAVYAIPMEEESSVADYSSTDGKQHKAYGNAGTVVPRTPSYESAMLDGNDGQQKRPQLQSNTAYAAAAVGVGGAQRLTTASSKQQQQQQQPQRRQQQSVYLGFGDRDDNETDNV